MKVIKQYADDVSANLAKAVLDQHGIPCLITNSSAAAVEGPATAFGGSQIAVAETMVAQAEQLLAAHGLQ